MVINIKGYDVVIDEEDYDKVMSRTWRILAKRGNIYFTSYVSKHNKHQIDIPLHHLIMDRQRGDSRDIDHINRNTLDNRKCNLRFASKAQNRWNQGISKGNTSGYKGVSKYRGNLYRATISHMGVYINIGTSLDIVECAKMYDMMAIKLFGEFACVNFPDITYSTDDIENIYKKVTSNTKVNNTSGYTGVTYHKGHKKWMVNLRYKGAPYFLGYFDDPECGAHVFDRKVLEIGADKNKLNFPEEYYI